MWVRPQINAEQRERKGTNPSKRLFPLLPRQSLFFVSIGKARRILVMSQHNRRVKALWLRE